MRTPRFLIAAAVTFCALTSGAQQPSPNLAGIAHVAVRVHDLAASVAFYEKLGFVKAFALSRDGAEYEAFIKINDNQFIELYPATAKDSQIGFLHVCFEGEDLTSVHDFYVAQGLKPGEVAIHGAGNRLFTMPGPASPTGPQNMEYTQYMPGSLHVKDMGKHLGADRISTEMIATAIAVDDPAAAHAFYVDKLKFLPQGATFVGIPGEPNEKLEIVPSKSLDFKARLTFSANLAKAAVALTSSGVPFAKAGATLTLTDPDANQIVLAEVPAKP